MKWNGVAFGDIIENANPTFEITPTEEVGKFNVKIGLEFILDGNDLVELLGNILKNLTEKT
jgi:hypothetical protein